jgi:hypothetical protein
LWTNNFINIQTLHKSMIKQGDKVKVIATKEQLQGVNIFKDISGKIGVVFRVITGLVSVDIDGTCSTCRLNNAFDIPPEYLEVQ